MSIVINYEHSIAASQETVWEVISDLKSYGEWNPFVVACESSMQVGSPIVMKVNLFPPIPMRQKETIQGYRDGEYLSYGIKLPLGALSSTRQHCLSKDDNGATRYESLFELKGWMSPLVKFMMSKRMAKGFDGMSRGIKQRAELLEQQKGIPSLNRTA